LADSDHLYFGSGFTLARIANYTALQGDNLIVGRCLGAEALGLYGRAYQMMVMPAQLFGSVLDRVLFPAMAKVQMDDLRLAKAYKYGVAATALVVLPASAVVIVLAPELVAVVLGSGWDEVVVPLQILAVGMLFRTSYKVADSVARATGAVFRRAWRQWIYAAVMLGGVWFGQHYGLPGVAVAVLVAITLNFCLMSELSIKLTSINWKTFLSAHVPAFCLSIIVGMLSWSIALVMRNLMMPALIILAVAVIISMFAYILIIRFIPHVILGHAYIEILDVFVTYLAKYRIRKIFIKSVS